MLVKIEAEGIECALLTAALPWILAQRPTLVSEVLSEARELGHLLRKIAETADYRIYVVPAYGSGVPALVHPADFDAEAPRCFNSKDVILTVAGLA